MNVSLDHCNEFHLLLSDEQIKEFIDSGVLVVDNVLSPNELQAAQEGLSNTLFKFGVDTNLLSTTGHGLSSCSSTNGSGGVLDLFYPSWKMDIATNPRLFHVTTQLWEAAYCHEGETMESLHDEDEIFRWHPHGVFDFHRGFLYIDRIGYRLPTRLAEQLGAEMQGGGCEGKKKKKKKKCKSIQRSLTPHLDCCPETFFQKNKAKWRPIQCFVSLTDNLDANTGGFEAAKGFHKTFHHWIKHRPLTKLTQKEVNGTIVEAHIPAPCIGEYTHIRPMEDRDVMDRIQHIPVRAGSVVLWDNRIPHANSYRHDGNVPRAVVYCSFLPDVEINRPFMQRQLLKWTKGQPPTDQWINIDDTSEGTGNQLDQPDHEFPFTPLGLKLMGIKPWS